MSRNIRPDIKLTNLDSTTRTCEFELTHASTAFANALRRVMIAEVPTFAFEHIEFRQNTSPLPDEFIAHRLGLIPLYSERAPEFKFQSECDCESGCPKCQVVYMINVACDDDIPRIVTTDDLEYFPPDDDHAFAPYIEAAQSIKPVQIPAIPGEDNVPITICKLGRGQVLQVLCKATKGLAREHAKWSPCSCAAYRLDPVIKVDQAFFAEKAKEGSKYIDTFIASCPSNVFKKIDSEEEPIGIENTTECTFCRQCQEWLESEGEKDSEGLIVIDQIPDKYIFKIESTGALRPEVIVLRAFEILTKKILDLLQHIKECPLS